MTVGYFVTGIGFDFSLAVEIMTHLQNQSVSSDAEPFRSMPTTAQEAFASGLLLTSK